MADREREVERKKEIRGDSRAVRERERDRKRERE